MVIAGSFNYTGPANAVNDENIIILGDLDAGSQAVKKAQAEIERIIAAHGTAM